MYKPDQTVLSRVVQAFALICFSLSLVASSHIAFAQALNPLFQLNVVQRMQNWPLLKGTGVATLLTDSVYNVTDTPANNGLWGKYWGSGYQPTGPKDTSHNVQNASLRSGTTSDLGVTDVYPTGALPDKFLVPQVGEASSYLYFITGSPTGGGPPVTTIYSSVLTATYQQLTAANTVKTGL